MDLIGTRGTVRILADIVPRVFQLKIGNWSAQGRGDTWHPVPGDPMLDATAEEKSVQRGNARVADDWLDAIAKAREPACSGHTGMKALEMAMAVFEAGLTGQRVLLPMKNRDHPLRSG
jgi:predicted dehydrogenase